MYYLLDHVSKDLLTIMRVKSANTRGLPRGCVIMHDVRVQLESNDYFSSINFYVL